ncbi:AfsR/SARP family transcriptional regulator [Pseudonocardia endophytica]|uniref:DNA-binding SARP family transcriptional activator n=1 Tax=Pseudonocardia endophytica TaxID=401976 RepID=A0A4R1HMC6_PSEEN|nr:AfsR/SARP family transcriptional regulator [Pseudonocardia endophytica]TCK22281.1 DNA-binding SARP family transcriptional activator [Pseudonocardia endophytica]
MSGGITPLLLGGRMQLSVLGSLELRIQGERVRIGGRRECVVLAALAQRPNRVVPVETLVDAVWGEEPPTTARAQIQSSVHRLRKHLGGTGQAIETQPSGYRLHIADGVLDSERFAGLVGDVGPLTEAGDIEGAVAVLDEALALWTGPAFHGVDSDLVRQGAVALQDDRLAAVEERVRLLLELGRHESVVGELRTLCAENPLRERLRGLLMLALYRSGRQVESLEVYREARRTLLTEAGVEPGTELQELEHAILNRHAELDPPTTPQAGPADGGPARPGSPRQLPMCAADFVGRQDRVAEILEVLDAAEHDDASRFAVPVIAISGAGGVGKSALALRVAHEIADRYPDGHLYADLHGDPRMENTHAQLARFLHALGYGESTIPEDPQERAATFRTRLAGQRQLLVLDNASTEDQVMPLLPGNPLCAVIVTSRMRLCGLPGAHWIDLDLFDDATSTEMLAEIVVDGRTVDEPGPTADLVRYCGRLPLALRIAGTRLASRPHWKVAELTRRLADEARRLDEFSYRGMDLRPSMALTYGTLPEQAKRLFRLLAVPEVPEFSVWTAASLLDTGVDEAEHLLETLVDARMVEYRQHEGSQIRYGFHELVRFYARELSEQVESDGERRAALHRMLGAWMTIAQQAHRHEYGGDHLVLHGTAPRWTVPPHLVSEELSAMPAGRLETEPETITAVIRQAAALEMDELCWDLVLTSVNLFAVRGLLDEWLETVDMTHRLCERTDNRTGRAAMLYAMGTLRAMQQKGLGDAPRYYSGALDLFRADGNEHGQALVLTGWAAVDRIRGDVPAMLERYGDALVRMRQVGDPAGEARVLSGLAAHHVGERDHETAETLLTDALRLSREAGHLRGEIDVITGFVTLYLATGRISAARTAIHRVLREVRAVGDRIGEARALYGLAAVRHKEGRLDSAETTAAGALVMAEEAGDPLVVGETRHLLGEIGMIRGEESAAEGHLVAATALFRDLEGHLLQARSLALLAEVRDSLGEIDQAAEAAARANALLSDIDSREAVDLRASLPEAYREDGALPAQSDPAVPDAGTPA